MDFGTDLMTMRFGTHKFPGVFFSYGDRAFPPPNSVLSDVWLWMDNWTRVYGGGGVLDPKLETHADCLVHVCVALDSAFIVRITKLQFCLIKS